MTPEREAATEAVMAWVAANSVVTSERQGDVMVWTFTPAETFAAQPQETPHVGINLGDGQCCSVFDPPRRKRRRG